MKRVPVLFAVAAIVSLTQTLMAVTILNPDYQAQTYVRYDNSAIGVSFDCTFDSSGNLYVAHGYGDSARNGSVQMISPDRTIAPLIENLVDPRYIVWGGGTSFGNYLYVADRLENSHYSAGEVTRIDLNGNKTAFCSANQPGALVIDSSSSFRNTMYVANSASDKIVQVGSSGGTPTTFSDYPYGASGAIMGMALDTQGSYNNLMFVGNFSSSEYGGLYSIDGNGSASSYVELAHATAVAFDDTTQQLFGGSMFVAGKATGSENRWTLYQVNGLNDMTEFATFDVSPSWTRPDIIFGNDGSMYVMEYDSAAQETLITQITPVPEPATLFLFGIAGLYLRRKKS